MIAVQSIDWELGKIVRLEWSCGCTWDVELTPVFCNSHGGKDGAEQSGPKATTDAPVPANPDGRTTTEDVVSIPPTGSSVGDSLPSSAVVRTLLSTWDSKSLQKALDERTVPPYVYERLKRYAATYKTDAVFTNRRDGRLLLSRYVSWTDAEIAEALR